MTFAVSNLVALRYVAESTLGTTPSSPTLTPIRFTSESLNFNIDFEKSEEIRSDRMTPDTIQVGASADGSIEGELSYATYSAFIEGAMFSTWVTSGSTVAAATDIAINKTAGTPNAYELTSGATNFTSQSWVVGQFIKVTGFATAGTFWAQITSIAASALGIYPLTDEVDEAAGAAVTITPLNYVRNGTTTKSFTIQKAFTDLTTPEYYNFTGAVVDTMTLTLETRSILNVEFSFVSKSAAMTETQFSSATIGTANTNDVMNAVGNVAAIVFDGDPGATTFYFNNLEIEINNNVRGQEAVGTLGFIGIVPGRQEVMGKLELYFESSALFDKFRAATAFSLSFMVADAAGQRYIFTIPRAKYTSMEITAGGLDEDIFASAEFEGLVNSAGTYQFQISRATS
jgi:hypothetical protein